MFYFCPKYKSFSLFLLSLSISSLYFSIAATLYSTFCFFSPSLPSSLIFLNFLRFQNFPKIVTVVDK
ncbi:hypothetical protein PTKIN_Ptkin03bG0112300 [Pterospermum kingtungense]